ILEESVAGQHDAGLSAERLEEFELLRAQRDRAISNVHLVARGVDANVPDNERAAAPWHAGDPAQYGADARDELLWIERLGHVVVHAGLERLDLLHIFRARGQREDRRIGVSTNLVKEIESVRVRKPEGEHDERGFRLLD